MRKENGNILFLILIAVALFAALSYAVTKSTRSGSASIDNEQAELDAAIDDNCEASVNYAIDRVRTLNGCETAEISYELPSGANANPSAPADRSCHLFDANGGGIPACGTYLDVAVATGQISYGDTTTINLLPNGIYLRCTTFGFQFSSRGECDSYEWSLDGTTFTDGLICFAKDSTELTANGGQNIVARNYTEFMCQSVCGGPRFMQHFITGGSPTVTHYVDPANSFALEAYTGPCIRAFEPNHGTFTAFSCDCWRT